ncbi:MAG: hypothetical protein LBU32_09055 [Clostridiales bacterium]|jgi:hypothetical protein|nr:hypothetical protein [Clostridiales bacterium]
MSQKNSFKATPIPHRSTLGEPMEYFILSEDGKQTKATRAECIGRNDKSEQPHLLFVDEEGGRVYQLPRTAQNERLVRDNMRDIWCEAKHQERWACRTATVTVTDEGDEVVFEPVDTSKDADIIGVMEEKAILDTLYKALATLTQEDLDLINDIFWHGKTERQLAPELGLKEPKSVNKRKHRILEILRNNADLRSFFK